MLQFFISRKRYVSSGGSLRKDALRYYKSLYAQRLLDIDQLSLVQKNFFTKSVIQTDKKFNDLFSGISSILNDDGLDSILKQKKIEIYYSSFLSLNQEDQYLINPFWSNEFKKIFRPNWSELLKRYDLFVKKESVLNITSRKNLNSSIHLNNLMDPTTIVELSLYIVLKQTMESNESLEMTCRHDLRYTLLSVFKKHLIIASLNLFLNSFLKGEPNNKNLQKTHINLFLREIKNFLKDKNLLIALHKNYKLTNIFYDLFVINFQKKKSKFTVEINKDNASLLTYYLKNDNDFSFDFDLSVFQRKLIDCFSEDLIFSENQTSLSKKIFNILEKLSSGIIRLLSECKLCLRTTQYFPAEKRNRSYLSWFTEENLFDLTALYYFSGQLPMIVEPNDWVKHTQKINEGNLCVNYVNGGYLSNIESDKSFQQPLIKTRQNIKSKVSVSNFSMKSLNLLQKKAYKVDKEVFHLLKNSNLLKKEGIISNYDDMVKFSEDIYNKYKVINNQKELIKKKFNSIMKNLQYQIYDNSDTKGAIRMSHLKSYYLEEYNDIKDCLSSLTNIKNEIIGLKNNFYSSYSLFIKHNFIIRLVELYKDYTLYFPAIFDFRLRNYPFGWSFHRASGVYKYLLNSLEHFKYNNLGLKELSKFVSFKYGNSFDTEEQHLSFTSDLILKTTSKDFLENPSLLYMVKDVVPFLRGLIEIEHIQDKGVLNYKSGFMVDVDQNNSGSQIYSILSRSSNVAYLTNVKSSYITFEKNQFICKKDLYLNFIETLKLFLNYDEEDMLEKFKKKVFQNFDDNKKKNLKEDEVLLKNFTFYKLVFSGIRDKNFLTRALGKALVVPGVYGLGKYGASRVLLNYIKEKDIQIAGVTDQSVYFRDRALMGAGMLALLIMQFSYPRLFLYMDLLRNLGRQVTKEDLWIRFRTIDGSLIEYYYRSSRSITKSLMMDTFDYKSSVESEIPGKFYEFSDIQSLLLNDDKSFVNNNLIKDNNGLKNEDVRVTTTNPANISLKLKKHKRSTNYKTTVWKKGQSAPQTYTSFPPHFIHGIDGAIVRILITTLYYKLNYIVEPLHDSFRQHPNFVPIVVRHLKYFYLLLFYKVHNDNKYFDDMKHIQSLVFQEDINDTSRVDSNFLKHYFENNLPYLFNNREEFNFFHTLFKNCNITNADSDKILTDFINSYEYGNLHLDYEDVLKSKFMFNY